MSLCGNDLEVMWEIVRTSRARSYDYRCSDSHNVLGEWNGEVPSCTNRNGGRVCKKNTTGDRGGGK